MKLNAPTQPFFLISLVLAILGVVGSFATISFVSVNAFWFVVAGYIVLAAGCILKGL